MPLCCPIGCGLFLVIVCQSGPASILLQLLQRETQRLCQPASPRGPLLLGALLGGWMIARCPPGQCCCGAPNGCEAGALSPTGLPGAPLAFQEVSQASALPPAPLPAAAFRHRSRFTNLRDSVKKSPTKSTAKVKGGSGCRSACSRSGCSLAQVRHLFLGREGN